MLSLIVLLPKLLCLDQPVPGTPEQRSLLEIPGTTVCLRPPPVPARWPPGRPVGVRSAKHLPLALRGPGSVLQAGCTLDASSAGAESWCGLSARPCRLVPGSKTAQLCRPMANALSPSHTRGVFGDVSQWVSERVRSWGGGTLSFGWDNGLAWHLFLHPRHWRDPLLSGLCRDTEVDVW